MIKALVAAAFIGLNFYTYYYLAHSAVYPERRSFDDFPMELDDWRCYERGDMDAKTEKNLGVSDYFLCRYVRSDQSVDLYVGYHASQVREEGGGAGENSIHPPAHCLPGSGWDIIDNKNVEVEIEGMPHQRETVKRLIIAKGDYRQLVYYWYHSRGRVIAQDWKKIFFVGLDRAVRQRTDGSLVRFTIPIVRNDEERAEEDFRELAPLVMTRLSDFVPD